MTVTAAEDTERQTADAPLITIYYWRRGFVLLAPSFLLDRRNNPYSRLSATLMFALSRPFTLETDEGGDYEGQAVLIAPKVTRRHLSAMGSDLVICDLAVTTPEFQALMPLLDGQSVRPLDVSQCLLLAGDFARARRGELSAQDMQVLLQRTILQFSGRLPEPPQMHPRIVRALQLIQDRPLSEITPDWLARNVHLSASRLRQLFSSQIGSNLTHYLRWNAAWRAAWLWSRGQPLAKIAESVGFYDLAHLNRVFNEFFGLNPTALFRPEQVRLIRCDWS